MLDQDILFEALSGFPRVLVETSDVRDVLQELVERSAKVAGVAGAGVAVRVNDTLAFATTADESIATIERAQADARSGPCVDAHRGGEPVVVADLAGFAERWPEVVAAAAAVGIRAAAAIPMHVDGESVGVLALYDTEVHEWCEEQLRAAGWLADTAAAYVVIKSRLERAENLASQLQHALDSRVVLEQAKGMLAGRLDVDLEDSFALLRTHARNHGLPLSDVATHVIDGSLAASRLTAPARRIRARRRRSPRAGDVVDMPRARGVDGNWHGRARRS